MHNSENKWNISRWFYSYESKISKILLLLLLPILREGDKKMRLFSAYTYVGKEIFHLVNRNVYSWRGEHDNNNEIYSNSIPSW